MLAVIVFIAACKKTAVVIPNPTPTPSYTIKDIDGYLYDTVTIGSQVWIKQNLKTTHYRNGDPIPQVTNPTAWAELTTGAWCWYNNDSANYSVFGRLYNWYAVNDARKLAPAGWHIPTEAEFNALVTGLGGDALAGGKLKVTGTSYWLTPNTGATNSSRFTGLGAGFRAFHGGYAGIGTSGLWWAAGAYGTQSSLAFELSNYLGSSKLNESNWNYAFSVRCLKD